MDLESQLPHRVNNFFLLSLTKQKVADFVGELTFQNHLIDETRFPERVKWDMGNLEVADQKAGVEFACLRADTQL